MYRPRVIPCLLLGEEGLVKTTQFKDPSYVGDPINAVKIFNEFEADELIFLDIIAAKKRVEPRFDIIHKISEETMMPFSFGGGITGMDSIDKTFQAGAEKIILNTICFENPSLVSDAAKVFGSQSIIVSVDYTYSESKHNHILWSHGGLIDHERSILEHCLQVQDWGAGELMLHSIDRDGMMNGYDGSLIERISDTLEIPVIACGGAKNLDQMRDVIFLNNASAAAAGAMFVYWGANKAVMINYPDQEELIESLSID